MGTASRIFCWKTFPHRVWVWTPHIVDSRSRYPAEHPHRISPRSWGAEKRLHHKRRLHRKQGMGAAQLWDGSLVRRKLLPDLLMVVTNEHYRPYWLAEMGGGTAWVLFLRKKANGNVQEWASRLHGAAAEIPSPRDRR